jgi:release factor glutamine methyltransferase
VNPQLHNPLELVRVTAEFFADKGIDSPRLDAELLLAHVLGLDRLQLYLQHDRPLIPAEVDAYRELVRQRGQRIPLQHLLGETTVLDHRYLVRPGVFVPRPETETLIEVCASLGEPGAIVEVGPGTGVVGLSLLARWPQATLYAVDIEPAAVELSRENAARLGLEDRTEFVCADALSSTLPSCDLFVSNPPYVVSSIIDELEPEVSDHDPRVALDGGPDGLEFFRQLLPVAFAALGDGGWIALEHGDDQGQSVPALLREAGFNSVRDEPDLAGRARVAVGHKPATGPSPR